MLDVFVALIYSLGVCTLIALLVWIFQEVSTRLPPKKQRYSVSKPLAAKPSTTFKPPTNPQEAKRLRQIVTQLKAESPGHTDSWYWNAAWQRLELDRPSPTRKEESEARSSHSIGVDTFKPSAKSTSEKEPTLIVRQTVSGTVQNKLYRLVKGDWKTAERLLQNIRRRNPTRSEQWVWEKVIWDLERDRIL